MIVDPDPKLYIEESNIISSYFGMSIGNHSNKVISKIILTHLLKRWEKSKNQSYPRFFVMTQSENFHLRFVVIF